MRRHPAPNRPACEARSAVTQADRGLYYTLIYYTFTGSGPKRPACEARFALAQSSSEECRLLGQSPSAQCDCVVSGASVSCPHLEFPQQKFTGSPKLMPLPWALVISLFLSAFACSFEVTVTSVSLPPFVSRRGLSNTNQRLSLNNFSPGRVRLPSKAPSHIFVDPLRWPVPVSTAHFQPWTGMRVRHTTVDGLDFR